MTDKELEAVLLDLVRQVLPPDNKRPPLSLDTKLLDDPLMDSLTMASLGTMISEKLQIDSDEILSRIPDFRTVRDVLQIVRPLVGITA